MILKELLTRIATGELSNLAWADNGNIKQDKLDTTVKMVNEVLNKIYSQFYLKYDHIFVELQKGKTTYDITSEHLMGKDLKPSWNKYLWQPGKEFKDDLLKIVSVKTSNGIYLPLNDPDEFYNVTTSFYNRIVIPNFKPEWKLQVIYVCKHKELTATKLDEKIDLPESLIPAVCAYVAYMVHNNMNTELSVANANKYLQLYNSIIQENINTDISIYPKETFDKFHKRGWC